MSTLQFEVEPHVLLRVQGCAGDVEIVGHESTTFEIESGEALERYLRRDDEAIIINGYPDSLAIRLPKQASVELNGIGGDVEVRSIGTLGAQGTPKLAAHSVGGDVRIVDVLHIQLGLIGGDVEIEGGCEVLQIGNVGGDLQLDRVAQCSIQAVGGDAELGQVDRLVTLGRIGGDLSLAWSGTAEAEIRAIIGGDADLRLPENANVKLTAMVGGDLEGRGPQWRFNAEAGRHELVFGEGHSHVILTVGGDLEIHGAAAPKQGGTPFWNTNDRQRMHESMNDFSEEMRGLGRELEEMGRNLARELSGLGREIAREVRVAGRETMRGMKQDFGARSWGPRGRVRINERDFNLDSEQIERIKREARAAAASGVARAQEAVERALQQWQQGGPSRPNAPRPPASPAQPTPPAAPPVGHVYTGQTIRMDRQNRASEGDVAAANGENSGETPANDLDAERLAILRMVHEGRLGPDEAELLLRSLEARG